ncbi:RNAse P, Rpr2/Rpp21 subunit [mine drainage metagenome]|uniref:RNAse P, Rpr2/Rpp21 subunit n=1 Tax=mine drainage metagenome TaxID=410659 RepID=T0YA25_9ZZZZ
MVRIAEARVEHLFRLATQEAMTGPGDLPDRYVRLARRIGTRYNVRLRPEFRDLYCRGCSAFWVEGRTVRTRLRSGRTVRTCLRCGRARRVRIHASGLPTSAAPSSPARAGKDPDPELEADPADGDERDREPGGPEDG